MSTSPPSAAPKKNWSRGRKYPWRTTPVGAAFPLAGAAIHDPGSYVSAINARYRNGGPQYRPLLRSELPPDVTGITFWMPRHGWYALRIS